ncbi:MAG: alpha/beta hydrolase, partial [Saprospiraceae bacterium]
MKNRYLLAIVLAFACILPGTAQRYLTSVFDNVTLQTKVYGYNWTVLTVPVTGNPLLQPLVMDLYEPAGDTETARPLVIYLHTGNFLPFPQNQSPSGTIKDSATVEIATRLTKMGYVVAVADYRLGWNPVATTQDERINTLINAAYRGVQDARTCIRHCKLNAAAYKIDSTKITLFGQGTGGYIALAAATLDDIAKISNTTTPPNKFIGTNGFPMVLGFVNGNIWATDYGVVPAGPLIGDTLCQPNNVGPSSDFQLAVNLGGALADISWLEGDHPAILSIQSPTDPFAPYTTGVVIVPGVNLPVVEVQGSYIVQQTATNLGNNDAFQNVNFTDPISVEAE